MKVHRDVDQIWSFTPTNHSSRDLGRGGRERRWRGSLAAAAGQPAAAGGGGEMGKGTRVGAWRR